MAEIEKGREIGGRTDPFEFGHSAFVAFDEADEAAVRKQIAFYGSTPAYRPVLDLHGWGDLQSELNVLSKQGRWDDMTGLVDDEVFAAMTSVGSPKEVAADLQHRFGGIVDRIRFNLPGDVPSPTKFAELVDAMKGL